MNQLLINNCHLCSKFIAKGEVFYSIGSGIVPSHYSTIKFHTDCFTTIAGEEYVALLAHQALDNIALRKTADKQNIIDKWNEALK